MNVENSHRLEKYDSFLNQHQDTNLYLNWHGSKMPFFHLEFLFKKNLFFIPHLLQNKICRFVTYVYMITVQFLLFQQMCVLFEHHMVLCSVFSAFAVCLFKNTARLSFTEMSRSFYCHRIGFYFAIITNNLIKQKITPDFYFLR